jgi:hypothetical protein
MNTQKRKENYSLEQSLRTGIPNHPNKFKKAVKIAEFFQPQKPIMPVSMYPILNTFDNSKRWLKDLTIESNIGKSRRHYKGKAWSYVNNPQSDFFDIVSPIPHEELEQHPIITEPLFRRTMEASKKNFFKGSQIDLVHIKVPFNPIHDVQYTKEPIKRAKTSLLNER